MEAPNLTIMLRALKHPEWFPEVVMPQWFYHIMAARVVGVAPWADATLGLGGVSTVWRQWLLLFARIERELAAEGLTL